MTDITQAAINVELARTEARKAHRALCDAIVYVDAKVYVDGQGPYDDPRPAFVWASDIGEWISELPSDDPRFEQFIAALEDRREARRKLGARRGVLTKLVRKLIASEAKGN